MFLEPEGEGYAPKSLIYIIGHLGFAVFPVYFHFYIFEKYFYGKRYWTYTVLLLVTLIAFGIVEDTFLSIVISYEVGVIANIFFITFLIFIATALKLMKASIQQRMLVQRIKAKHLQTELDLLKSQINPHFLFNTLNNLFSMARNQKDQSTANGIAKLSHLMRYMIYESNVEAISLNKEIDQINNFIELQKLRFSEDDDINIVFDIEGNIDSKRIPPMLLVPFIENAFKHGISIKNPSSIEINLTVENQKLQFTIKNTVHKLTQMNNNEDSKIGLKNVKRRLELLYPDSHELKIHNDNKNFEIILRLFI